MVKGINMLLPYNEIKEIDINLTGYCNLNCPLCDINTIEFKEFRKNKSILTIDEWLNIIDKFPKLNQINFIGKSSEPTLYPNFIKLCDLVKRRNLTIVIRSNGDTNNIDFWYKLGLLLNGNDRIYFAIEGTTDLYHSKYRVGSNLTNILKNHEAFKKANGMNNCDYIQTVEFQHNTEDINSIEFQKIRSKFSGSEIIISSDYPEYIMNRKWIKPVPSDITALRKNWSILKKIDTGKITKLKCASYSNKSIYIDFDGMILPCCGIPRRNIPSTFDNKKELDYSHFIKGKEEACRICDINLEKFAEKFNLRNRHND